MRFEQINCNHRLFVEPSPNEADLAIVSIDSDGNLGSLNEFVLVEYGYSAKDLPSREQLQYAGFGSIPRSKGKPILFVVTIDGVKETQANLETNLYRALTEFRGWFQDKKVWLPLMGTGAGRLTLEESYVATAKAINKFQGDFPTEVFLIVSLPATEKGKALYEALQQTTGRNETENDFQAKSNEGSLKKGTTGERVKRSTGFTERLRVLQRYH